MSRQMLINISVVSFVMTVLTVTSENKIALFAFTFTNMKGTTGRREDQKKKKQMKTQEAY